MRQQKTVSICGTAEDGLSERSQRTVFDLCLLSLRLSQS